MPRREYTAQGEDKRGLRERRRKRLHGLPRPIITQDPALSIVGTRLEQAKRQAIGYDLIGAARMLESLSLGLREHRMFFHHYFTDKERAFVEHVELKLILKAAGVLRRIGNHMVQERLPE